LKVVRKEVKKDIKDIEAQSDFEYYGRRRV
jgi:hypothetical protein